MTRFILNQTVSRTIIICSLIFITHVSFTQSNIIENKVEVPDFSGSAKELLDTISKKENIIFAYSSGISLDYEVSFHATEMILKELLEFLFDGRSIGYKVKGNKIILYPIKELSYQTIGLNQTIRGSIFDIESRIPLIGATVIIKETNPPIGTITDINGIFRLEKVPVGRISLLISYIGYEPKVIPELLISSGKEIVLEVGLKEQISELKEVVVKAYTKKDKPLNSMATLSARTFSVEEARRYAGGFDDPGRLAASFAGITTENSRDNTIIIRGNSPKGLLWRLEGIEISNPNHFANQATFGGGGISAISALVVGNSDFFTGAFPAEYGNAVSGVFDIKLRNGNNEIHEHAFQLGTMGIDISSEGPFSKNNRASYLFNYRYSTMGLLKEIFPEDIKNFIPVYQDLCFKINIPTKKTGIFSLWGLASADKSTFPAVEDTSKWEITMDRMDNKVNLSIGALGLNHRYIFGKQSWLNTSLAVTGDYMKYEDDILDYDLKHHEYNNINVVNFKYTLTSVYNHKFSAKHSNRIGFILDNMHYNLDLQYAPVVGQKLFSIAEENGVSNIIRFFSQSKINITKRFMINGGLHGHYFNLNNEFVIEPRLGLTYSLNKSQSVSFAYGKHSRIEPLTLYFAKVYQDGNNFNQPNKDLKVSKAHHLVLAYDISLNPNLRLKIEPYLQYLYDIPVIPDSNYSVLNMETEWFHFDNELINTGIGKNMGIDFTLERFLQNGSYYLFTASLFDSKFKGDDGIEHNTRFNTQFVINFLYGKEWIMGIQHNKILGVNVKVNFSGGKRITPINQGQSILAEDVVYYYTNLFKNREPDKLHVNATINYRINKKNHASIWSIQMMNIFLTKESYGYFYNYKSRWVEPWELAVPTPSLSYKIEF